MPNVEPTSCSQCFTIDVAVLGHERVERVARLEVGQIGPRAEHAQGAELAPVLVRHDVVRIVRPRPLVAEVAEDLARQQPAGDDAIRAVRLARDVLRESRRCRRA